MTGSLVKNPVCSEHNMQAYNIVLYVLILSGVCCTFRKKKTDKYSWILAIYWCGALVFYIFLGGASEAVSKYIAFIDYAGCSMDRKKLYCP